MFITRKSFEKERFKMYILGLTVGVFALTVSILFVRLFVWRMY